MKKAADTLSALLFVLTAFHPVAAAVSAACSMSLELAGYGASAVITAALSIAVLALNALAKTKGERGIYSVLRSLTAPFSVVNAISFALASPEPVVIAATFADVVFSCIMGLVYGGPNPLRLAAGILSAAGLVPMGFIIFASLLFGNIGSETVVETIESPDGGHYARIIDSDQGALGGDTLVAVYGSRELDLLAFKIVDGPHIVYTGDWLEWEHMDIYWRDEDCLVINSREYKID